MAGEINLDNAAGAVVARSRRSAPATTAPHDRDPRRRAPTRSSATWSGQPATSSATGPGQRRTPASAAPAAVKPVTVADLSRPNKAYQAYAAAQLRRPGQRGRARSRADLRPAANLAAATRDWLAAQLDWDRVGASYDSFGDLGAAVDGLPDGLPDGVNDKDFTGLHRLEYGLWHGQSAAELAARRGPRWRRTWPRVRRNLTSDELAGDPTEPAAPRPRDPRGRAARPPVGHRRRGQRRRLRRRPTPTCRATRVVLGELAPLIHDARPDLLPTARAPARDAADGAAGYPGRTGSGGR